MLQAPEVAAQALAHVANAVTLSTRHTSIDGASAMSQHPAMSVALPHQRTAAQSWLERCHPIDNVLGLELQEPGSGSAAVALADGAAKVHPLQCTGP
jgi:hypothetical protein